MNPLFTFAQKLIQDLKLDQVTPSVKKMLESRITQVVDNTIQETLDETLSPEGWRKSTTEELEDILKNRPDVQAHLEHRIASTYDDFLLRNEAIEEINEIDKN